MEPDILGYEIQTALKAVSAASGVPPEDIIRHGTLLRLVLGALEVLRSEGDRTERGQTIVWTVRLAAKAYYGREPMDTASLVAAFARDQAERMSRMKPDRSSKIRWQLIESEMKMGNCPLCHRRID